MRTKQINIPITDEKQEAIFDLLLLSGQAEALSKITSEIEKACTCEPRKKPDCSCEILVCDLLKALKGAFK